jgi:hypothetical protein
MGNELKSLALIHVHKFCHQRKFGALTITRDRLTRRTMAAENE